MSLIKSSKSQFFLQIALHNGFKRKSHEFEIELIEKYEDLIECTDDHNRDYSFSTVESLSEDIEKSITLLTQPSYATIMLISTLWSILDNAFGMKLQVTNKCNNS